MIPFIGNISLILSLLLVIAQVFLPARFYRTGAIAVFSLMLFSFLCLIYSYIVSDFSVLNVYNNSHTLKPIIYKITGAWGNHEGSMLLLILILCGYNLFFVYNYKPQTKNYKLIVTAYLAQLLITAGFLSFIILTSNPFIRIYPTPEDGLGLNPLLQDIGLAMHPPMLYLGYIGFSIAFSLSIAALIHGKGNKEWSNLTRKWVLSSWMFLTLGIGLGSWWAYRELGWGGFWFWDPVENVSLMPWLAATGLYHSLIASEKRNLFTLWSILLAIITFCLSLIGIFLVRSGVVSSVHAFASDPSRGVFILGFLAITGLCAFTLFALRAGKFPKAVPFPALSREAAMMLNNIFFVTLSATVLLGTMYPIFAEIFSGTRVSVSAPYFNATFNKIAVLMLVFTAIAPFIKWGDNSANNNWAKIFIPIIAGVIAGIFAYIKNAGIFSSITIAVAVFLFLASVQLLFNFTKSIGFFKKLPLRVYGMVIAHCGAAILVIGIAITTTFGVEKEQVLKQGEKLEFANYEAVLVSGEPGTGKNYMFQRAHFRITENGNEITNLYPEIRLYPVEESSTIEADLYYTLFSNIYAAVGEVDKDGIEYATRIYYKPMVNLIWLGCVMMAIGGLLAVIKKKEM